VPRVTVPIDGGFYESDSLPISSQQCVNWFVNKPQTAGALSPGTLIGCAGVRQIQTSGTERAKNCRGAHTKSGLPYFLNGTELIRVDKTIDVNGNAVFTNVILGTIPGSQRVSMADNGKQLMILVPGVDGYIVDESSGTPFQIISDVDFKANGNPEIVEFIDSFFVCSTDSKKYIKSAANDGLDWNALDFGSAETDPDAIVSLHVHKNKLYVAGSETIEEVQNLGLGGFPFQRTGLYLNKGVKAPFSMIETGQSFMFIGGGVNESPAIWGLSGGGVQKVSTTAIDAILQRLTEAEVAQAFAYSYSQQGAFFVGFSLPNETLEYNVITGKWNERKSDVVTLEGKNITVRWRVNAITAAYGEILCGDSQDGRIGIIDFDTYSEYEREIIRTFAVQPLANNGAPISITQAELTVESGVGNLAIKDPQIRLSTSNDGKSYNNELSRSLGKIGEHSKRIIWNKLGRFPRFAVLKFVMSDKLKAIAIKLELNIKGGSIGG